jgi:hypothetical protein
MPQKKPSTLMRQLFGIVNSFLHGKKEALTLVRQHPSQLFGTVNLFLEVTKEAFNH